MTLIRLDMSPVPYSGNPIISLGSAWFIEQLYDPTILFDPSDSSNLIMFASGMAAPAASGEQSIGRFTSTVANPYSWVEYGQLLTKGGAGTWDEIGVRHGCTIYTNSTFKMYYTGENAAGVNQIGLATSSDGIIFTKSASNPILTPTGQGRNDGTHVSQPAVLKEGSTATMIYSYRDTGIGAILPGFRYATSSDDISFTKQGSGDILTTSPLYGEQHQIIKINNQYALVFESGNGTNPFQIYIATSSSVSGPYNRLANPILRPSGNVGAWDRYHVATPWLMEIGNGKLFYCAAGNHDQPYSTNTWPFGVADFVPMPSIVGGRKGH